jgi:hypothetical protein
MADNEWIKFVQFHSKVLNESEIDFKGKGKGARLTFIGKLWAEKKFIDERAELAKLNDKTEELLNEITELEKKKAIVVAKRLKKK